MTASNKCPTCDADLVETAGGMFCCPEMHEHTVLGLVRSTNLAAVRALWRAIRALEDDALGLLHLADRYGDSHGGAADARRAEAAEARADAQLLREHAHRAQARVDALIAADTSALEIDGPSSPIG